MNWRFFWLGCLGFCFGCAALTPDAEQQKADDAAYFQAVEERREPVDFLYIYEEPEAYEVALASADLKEGEPQRTAAREAEQACKDQLKEALKPRIAGVIGRYDRWFTWAERQEDSDVVARLAEQAAQASLKVWGRFYFAIRKYQTLRCVHRTQIEIDIISDALIRERDLGGTEIEGMVRRMERLQARYIFVSEQLNFRQGGR